MPMRLVRWLAHHQLVAHLFVTTMIVGVVFGLALARDRTYKANQAAHDACVDHWAQETTARFQALGEARKHLDDADRALWDTAAELIAHPTAAGQAALAQRVLDRVNVAKEYEGKLEDHPIPAPPQLACA